MIENLIAVAVRNGASFEDASAFVDAMLDAYSVEELETRNLQVLWMQWVERDSIRRTDYSIVGCNGQKIQRF